MDRMRPARGALGRRAPVCATHAVWGSTANGARSKQYPPLSYSINRRDIMGAELGLLLAAARSRDMDAGGPPLCRHTYSYWCSQAGLRHAAKLELALRRSVATVACFTSWDVYGDTGAAALRRRDDGGGGGEAPPPLSRPPAYQEEECPLSAAQHQREREMAGRAGSAGGGRRSPSGGASPLSPRPSPSWEKPPTPGGVPDMDWNWLLPSGGGGGGGGGVRAQSAPPRKSLVGFARATGDNSLVATIYDVAVHPAMRGYGIGGRLVKLLVQQVQARAVYDIGVVTPAGAAGFWERCGFEDDREGSTCMTWTGARDAAGPGWAPRSSEELLQASCLGHWEAAQRSESLRALLGAKLAAASAAAAADAEAGGTGAGEDGWGGGAGARRWRSGVLAGSPGRLRGDGW